MLVLKTLYIHLIKKDIFNIKANALYSELFKFNNQLLDLFEQQLEKE